MVVQAITINPKADTKANGTIFCLTLFQSGCPLGNVTSQMQSIVSRNTEKAPMAPPIEKPTTTTAVQAEVNGDAVFVIN